MRKQQNLINFRDPKTLMDLLRNPKAISRLIAGVLASNMSEHTLAAGRIIDAAIKRQLLCQLSEEINSYHRERNNQREFFGKKQRTNLLC